MEVCSFVVEMARRGTVQEIPCAVCNVSTEIGDAICCDYCDTWYHYICVGVSDNDSCVLNPEEKYGCPACRQRVNGLNTSANNQTNQHSQPQNSDNLVDVNAVIVDVDVVTAVVEDPLVNPLVNNVPESTQTPSQSQSQQQSRVVRGVIVGE